MGCRWLKEEGTKQLKKKRVSSKKASHLTYRKDKKKEEEPWGIAVIEYTEELKKREWKNINKKSKR